MAPQCAISIMNEYVFGLRWVLWTSLITESGGRFLREDNDLKEARSEKRCVRKNKVTNTEKDIQRRFDREAAVYYQQCPSTCWAMS